MTLIDYGMQPESLHNAPARGSYSQLMPSPVAEWTDFLNDLEKDLVFPVTAPSNIPESLAQRYMNSQHAVCEDPVILICGCIMNEQLFLDGMEVLGSLCPICGTQTEILAPIMALRHLAKKIAAKKAALSRDILAGAAERDTQPSSSAKERSETPEISVTWPTSQKSNVDVNDITSIYAASLSNTQSIAPSALTQRMDEPPIPKMSLAEIFQSAAKVVLQEEATGNALFKTNSHANSGTIDASFTSGASSGGYEDWRASEFESINFAHFNISIPQFEKQEMYYKKCFPSYRKQYQHNLNSRLIISRSKPYISTAISPDTSKIAVATDKKWSVYWTPQDYNDSPTLLCSGKSSGEIQLPPEKGKKVTPQAAATATVLPLLSPEEETEVLTDWDHKMISLSNRYLAVAGTNGILRVYDLENEGKCVYHHKSKFGIRYLSISPNGTLIACAITGIDNTTKSEQPMIVLHWLQLGDTSPLMTRYTNSLDSVTQIPGVTVQVVETVTITIPYRDVINCLSFSRDETFLSCGTQLTAHILIINVTNPHEPRMMLKTSRSTDKQRESEGITSIEFFPRSRFFAVSSVALNSYPMIVDSKIQSNNPEAQVISRLSIVTRVEKVGSAIHRAAVSHRDNALALLDKNGLVYLMHAPMFDKSKKRIFVVTEVSSSPCYLEAASMRFTPSGHALFIVDRKGNFHVEDFAAGSPQQAGIGKCRILS